MQLRELIEQAAERAGSKTTLAAMLGVDASRLNHWRTGTRPCPLHVQARIAQVAGVDPKEWVWEQVARQMRGATAAALIAVTSLAAYIAPVVGGATPSRRDRKARRYTLG